MHGNHVSVRSTLTRSENMLTKLNLFSRQVLKQTLVRLLPAVLKHLCQMPLKTSTEFLFLTTLVHFLTHLQLRKTKKQVQLLVSLAYGALTIHSRTPQVVQQQLRPVIPVRIFVNSLSTQFLVFSGAVQSRQCSLPRLQVKLQVQQFITLQVTPQTFQFLVRRITGSGFPSFFIWVFPLCLMTMYRTGLTPLQATPTRKQKRFLTTMLTGLIISQVKLMAQRVRLNMTIQCSFMFLIRLPMILSSQQAVPKQEHIGLPLPMLTILQILQRESQTVKEANIIPVMKQVPKRLLMQVILQVSFLFGMKMHRVQEELLLLQATNPYTLTARQLGISMTGMTSTEHLLQQPAVFTYLLQSF